jgi:hypothetical protein
MKTPNALFCSVHRKENVEVRDIVSGRLFLVSRIAVGDEKKLLRRGPAQNLFPTPLAA